VWCNCDGSAIVIPGERSRAWSGRHVRQADDGIVAQFGDGFQGPV
jgi:hypothetical protein